MHRNPKDTESGEGAFQIRGKRYGWTPNPGLSATPSPEFGGMQSELFPGENFGILAVSQYNEGVVKRIREVCPVRID